MTKVALITGVTGQDGAYLAEFLLGKGYEVHGIKRRTSLFNTDRIDHLYQDPHDTGRKFILHHGDLTDSSSLIRTIQQVQPDEIYNLAAQSHVAVSFEEPEYTANSDALGALRILEANYIWVSGGGTWLLNDRYLLFVQRVRHAKVNPGKFSLLTGRADNVEELLHPALLVRELFEELILFDGDHLYRPICEAFHGIIEQVYSRLEADLGLNIKKAKPLRLDHLLCAPKMVTVAGQDARWDGLLDCHVSNNGEVNVLFVLAGDVDIEKLQAMDGEYHLTNGKAVRQKRSIYLYDLYTATGRDITIDGMGGEPVPISEDAMTEHLRHIVESVKRRLAAGGRNRKSPSNEDQVQS